MSSLKKKLQKVKYNLSSELEKSKEDAVKKVGSEKILRTFSFIFCNFNRLHILETHLDKKLKNLRMKL